MAQLLLQLGSTMVLARLLAPSDFGLVAMVATLVALAGLLRDFGLSQAIIQHANLSESQATAAFWLGVLTSLVLALAMVFLGPVLAAFYGQPELIAVTVAFALVSLVGGVAAVPQAVLARQMAFKRLVAIETAGGLAGVAAAIAIAVAGGGYWALVAGPAVRTVVVTVLAWAACPWRPGRPRTRSGVGSLVRFGSHVSGANFMAFLGRNADDVMIGWQWGTASLGQYSAAYRILMLPLVQLNAPFSRVAIPALARLKGDEVRYRHAYLRLLRVLASVASPLMAFVVVDADWVVTVVLGPGWEQAAEILRWLAVVGILQAPSNTAGWLFVTLGRTSELFRWSVFSAALAITSFVVGLPYGPVGVAAAYALSGVLIRTPLLVYRVGRLGPVSSRDVVQVSLLPLALAGWAVIGAVAVRLAWPNIAALTGLATSAAVVVVGAAALILLTSPGRVLRADMTTVLAELRGRMES